MVLFSSRRCQAKSCCVYVNPQKIDATHASYNSIVVRLLGRSSFSSPSTKALHLLANSVVIVLFQQIKRGYLGWLVFLCLVQCYLGVIPFQVALNWVNGIWANVDGLTDAVPVQGQITPGLVLRAGGAGPVGGPNTFLNKNT